MFDAEKLLGGLVSGGLRRKSVLGSGMQGAAGMALLGVAIAAFEHFSKSSSPASTGAPPPLPQSTSPFPPPLPPTMAPGSGGKPPIPPSTGSAVEQHAMLLIRAMIAAANADNTISQEERTRILDRMRRFDLSSEERNFVENELLAPASLDAIAVQVKTPDVARQVYAASLMAIEVDTDAEREYLKALALKLGLDGAVISGIHQVLGIEPQL
jgi:uncharacterized membrane protein YebE (DUF533 family)